MVQATSSTVQAALARVAQAEAALFKVGQILQAVVLGTSSDGLTAVKIGDLVFKAQLPQPLPPGTALTLQVKASGATPQLVVVSQSSPQAAGGAVSASAPMPQAALEMLPEVAVQPKIAESAQGVVSGSSRSESPARVVAAETPQVLAPVTQAMAKVAPAQASQATLPRVAGQASSGAQPQLAAAAAGGAAPVAARVPSGMPPAAATAAVPVPAPEAGPGASVAMAGTAVAGASVTIAAAEVAPQPVVAAPVASQPVEQAAPQAAPSVPTAPAPASVPTAPAASVVATPAATLVAAPATPPQQISTPAAVPAPVASALPEASAPLAQSPALLVTKAAAAPASPAPTPEAPVASPLLLAQAAARPPVSLAELPHAASPAAVPQAAPPPSPSAPAATPAQQPPTPQAALAQMVPAAMAKQDSLAPLLQSLAAIIVRPGVLPEPVRRAALQVLALRVAVPAGQVASTEIERGVAKSGVYLEANLAKALPPQGDAKAALLALKDVLEKWLGPQPAATPAPERAAPPVRGLPLRGAPVEAPVLPEAPREIGRVLHEQADAAVSRIKLSQLAALPDSPAAPRAGGPELRMELPFLIGHELVMAQLQIMPDGSRPEARGKRGWTMRFAMHFAATGEVGAEIGLLGESVSVGLWAAEPEVAERLNASLPELSNVLEEIGLIPGAVRVRSAPPDAPKPPAGHLLDSTS